MNFNVCPICRAPVPADGGCERPRCLRLLAQEARRRADVERGEAAYAAYAAKLVGPRRWEELTSAEKQVWMNAARIARR